MHTVAEVMMILVCFNYLLKQTYRKVYSVVVSAAVCSLFVGMMWPYAIEQSKSRISDWLSDSALMLDIAVVLTLEVALHVAFCIVAAHIQTSERVKPSVVRVYRTLRWFPGVLIFPVLFSMLVAAIFAMPGMAFSAVAWSLAAAVMVAVPAGAWILKRLLPEKEIRLEILFLSNVLIAVLGVIATVNGRTAVAGSSAVDWMSLCGVSALVALGLVCGTFAFRIRQKKQLKDR